MKENRNPYDSLVAFVSRHSISPVEEMKLREIIKRIIEHESDQREREAFEGGMNAMCNHPLKEEWYEAEWKHYKKINP